MKHFSIHAAALLSALAFSSADAQVTETVMPLPATKLEAISTNVAVVIFKASTDMGAIKTEAGEVAVKSREVTDTSTGHKEQGLSVEISPKGQVRSVLQVDYDEIASLLAGIDYISKLDVSATPLTTFDAAYTTKGGFRIAALGSRRTGLIQFGVRDARTGAVPVTFSRGEMSHLWGLIDQAKATLDALRR